MIYEQYSQPFFDGDYKVLRGGSWAVAADILRPSFRNWDHPIRRQIFSGVRLAWDVLMCAATWAGWVSRVRWRRWCWIRRMAYWCSRIRRVGRSTA